MSPEMQTVARATQTWLQSSWHVQVPIAWLEACVEFLQEEAGGVGHLSQQQINQQALDQWLLTDLRDLDHPVLPEGISQAQKTELSGIFCVQVDSLLDVSQPAYSQLQSWRGTECANDQVSAVTQSTQRPWEAKPTRMLLLQVTDGVQSLEVMEYQPIPALSTTLRPGAKLQLKGRMVCRLGVLLLGPSNVKVLGGEVEDLVERNHQGRVLCRTLGLPEEEQPQEREEVLPAQQGNQEVEDLELDDAELLASLETQEGIPMRAVQDSGYQTLSDISTQSSRSSSVRSPVATVSSRSEASARSHRNGSTQSSRGGPFQDRYHRNEQDNSDLYDLVPPEHSIQRSIPDHNMIDEDFPDEDFDDLPLDELDGEMFEQSPDVSSSTHRSTRDQSLALKPQSLECSRPGFSNSRPTVLKRDNQGFSGGAKEQFVKPSHDSRASHDEDNFMDLDAECFLEELETGVKAASNRLSVQQQPRDKTKTLSLSCRPTSSSSRTETHQGQSITSSTAEPERFPMKKDSQSCSYGPAVTLTSPPFTYLSLLEKETSKQLPHPITIRVKAFIITLIGKLTSSSGFWRVCATISDGTGYLDVELSDEVLTGLLGFSVAEKAALKRDPARRGELEAGMRRCQEELVDMCCVMTIKVESEGGKAVVTKAERVSENMLQELEQRVKDTRK